MKFLNRTFVFALVLVLAALACNMPVSQAPASQDANAAYTAAAQTVSAQLTDAAQVLPSATLAPPSPTATFTQVAATVPPAATSTNAPIATATSNCDNALFVLDVTVADNTVMTPGQAFTKTWRLKNTGTCSWTPSYAVVFSSGSQMGGPAVQALTGNVNPGQTVDVSVDLTAPTTNGTYTGYWKLRNAAGVNFSSFYVQIVVNSGGGSGGGVFAVTSVQFQVTGTCPNFHVKVKITTNGAGTVKYHQVRSDGAIDTAPGTMVFSAAGSQIFQYDRYFGVSGSSAWADVYIDSPNHQQFGRATFTCP